MSRRMYDWQCSQGHLFEAMEHPEMAVLQCPECDSLASRLISAPTIKLEGITGAFPTAYDKWTRIHEEGAKKK